MRKSFWVVALLAIFAFVLPAKAQNEAPKAEVYALGTSFNFNGGSGQFAFNANHWLGIVGDLGGYYTSNGFHAGIFSYLFGPRINLRGHGRLTPFAQVLFGEPEASTTRP
jgi:hypothetical protein